MKKEICFISVILSDLVKSLCNENSKCGHSIIKENPENSVEIFIIQSHKSCKNFICYRQYFAENNKMLLKAAKKKLK